MRPSGRIYVHGSRFRGHCPACREQFSLTRAGAIPVHVDVWSTPVNGRRARCPGSLAGPAKPGCQLGDEFPDNGAGEPHYQPCTETATHRVTVNRHDTLACRRHAEEAREVADRVTGLRG